MNTLNSILIIALFLNSASSIVFFKKYSNEFKLRKKCIKEYNKSMKMICKTISDEVEESKKLITELHQDDI